MGLLCNFLENLGAYWLLTVLVVLCPFLAAGALKLVERGRCSVGRALFLGIATYLGGIPVPGDEVPRTGLGRSLLIVNRVLGVFAFGYLLAAFALALNQPSSLPTWR